MKSLKMLVIVSDIFFSFVYAMLMFMFAMFIYVMFMFLFMYVIYAMYFELYCNKMSMGNIAF